jgi:transglutaminase-like putative cysteine protease
MQKLITKSKCKIVGFFCLYFFFYLIFFLGNFNSVFGLNDSQSNTVASISLLSEESPEKIFRASELLIKQELQGGAIILPLEKPPAQIQSFTANFTFIPHNDVRQVILSQHISPNPISRSDSFLFFEWNLNQITESIDIEYKVESVIKTTSSATQVYSKVSYPYDKSELEQINPAYLGESKLIDITPLMRQKALELAQNSTDVYEIAFNIAVWVEQNIKYDLNTQTASASQKASWVFENKYGVCDELSTLYIAMLRSLDIPARFVSGMSYSNSDLFDSPWNPHAWVEVYMGEYGWMPVDLTYSQFGKVDATHIKLKVSHDADESQASYQWRARDLEKIQVQTKELEFFHTILNVGKSDDAQYVFEVTTLHPIVGIGSYNGLIIELENIQTTYISDTLYLSSTRETTFVFDNAQQSGLTQTDFDKIPFYLKPGESKTIFIPFKTNENLDTNYIYTVPIVARNAYGDEKATSYRISQNALYVERNDILESKLLFDNMQKNFADLENSDVDSHVKITPYANISSVEQKNIKASRIYCTQNSYLIINTNFTITCSVYVPFSIAKDLVENLESVSVCFESECISQSKFDSVPVLEDQSLSYAQANLKIPENIEYFDGLAYVRLSNFFFNRTEIKPKTYVSQVFVNYDTKSQKYAKRLLHTYVVSDVVSYEVTQITYPDVLTYPQVLTIDYTIGKISQASGTNVYVTLKDSKDFIWNFGSLSHNQTMRVSIHPDMLVGGKNILPLKLYYDTDSGLVVKEYEIEIDIQGVGFFKNMWLHFLSFFD